MMNGQANEGFLEMLSTQVLMQLAIGVILTDETGRILWCNGRQQWISGHKPSELTGKPFNAIKVFNELGLARIVYQVLTTGEPHYHFLTHQGLFCRTEVLPLRVQQRLRGAAILFYDREGEGLEKLERLKAKGLFSLSDRSLKPEDYLAFETGAQRALLFMLTQALDALPFPVIIFDRSLQILYNNTHFMIHHQGNDAAVGRSILEFIPQEAQEHFSHFIQNFLHHPVKKSDEKHDNVLTIQQSMYFLSRVDVRTGLDAVVMVIVPHRFMDSREKRDAFSDKFETLCQFTGRLVHDIRNPLTALMCELDELRNEDLYEKGGIHRFQKAIDLIQEQVYHLDGILNNIEGFGASVGDGRSECSLSEILLNARVVAELQRPFKNVHVQTDIDENMPPLMCEPLSLQKAIFEILLNGLEAAGEKGCVRLSARFIEKQNVYEIRIMDDGPGIPEPIIHRIFDPFFTTKKRPGAGLGLTHAYAAVRQHGGIIHVQTQSQKGTEMIIQLPCCQTPHR